MATKSILKNIDIRGQSLCWSFIRALENAEKKKGKEVVLTKSHRELSQEQIRKIFGDDNQ
ncbi:MAG: hypothetical protein FH749_15245 [Firmicutes bacterium]|nr:hypothetical protein [Bacillota bacterium]